MKILIFFYLFWILSSLEVWLYIFFLSSESFDFFSVVFQLNLRCVKLSGEIVRCKLRLHVVT